MHRRCIICGQDPGNQCVYPRNMKEARRWQNLTNLDSFDVDTESLRQHGCVCALHLDTDQEYGSDLGSTFGAVGLQRRAGGKISAEDKAGSKRSPFQTGRCQSTAQQYTNKKSSVGMNMQDQQTLESMPHESSNVDRSNIELHRCCGAMLQGNLYSQMRKNSCRKRSTGSTNETATRRNLKASKPTVPHLYACINYPILRVSHAVPKESTCPMRRSPSPAPASCTGEFSYQRTQNNSLCHSQQRPVSYDPLPCSSINQQQFKSDDDFLNSPCSSSGQTSFTTIESHQKRKPELRNQCCQACINCQLKDQEVQCSQHTLQPKASSEEVTPTSSPKPETRTMTGGSECDIDDKDCSCHRSASLATKYGSVNSKNIACSENVNMSNIIYGGEEQQYSVNAVNVLLMNGSLQNKYEGPNPEICVQQSDLADCNERAVLPDVDKPKYRVCRAATTGANTKGKQEEANVLVLEEGRMDGCSSEDQGQSQSELQFVEGINSVDQEIRSAQFCDNWINSPGAANYTKVLELQRARINELENLLQQHNKLQQTIQSRMAELQCQENPAKKANKK
ncbi:hypothetical protein KR038_004382 [Drosophila bunnanda]|nr:hypothetical protein KR038_004382 [Drosophila bunnanda]